ncbi:Hypothetical predicted protein, partial [Drosophila guanche]
NTVIFPPKSFGLPLDGVYFPESCLKINLGYLSLIFRCSLRCPYGSPRIFCSCFRCIFHSFSRHSLRPQQSVLTLSLYLRLKPRAHKTTTRNSCRKKREKKTHEMMESNHRPASQATSHVLSSSCQAALPAGCKAVTSHVPQSSQKFPRLLSLKNAASINLFLCVFSLLKFNGGKQATKRGEGESFPQKVQYKLHVCAHQRSAATTHKKPIENCPFPLIARVFFGGNGSNKIVGPKCLFKRKSSMKTSFMEISINTTEAKEKLKALESLLFSIDNCPLRIDAISWHYPAILCCPAIKSMPSSFPIYTNSHTNSTNIVPPWNGIVPQSMASLTANFQVVYTRQFTSFFSSSSAAFPHSFFSVIFYGEKKCHSVSSVQCPVHLLPSQLLGERPFSLLRFLQS